MPERLTITERVINLAMRHKVGSAALAALTAVGLLSGCASSTSQACAPGEVSTTGYAFDAAFGNAPALLKPQSRDWSQVDKDVAATRLFKGVPAGLPLMDVVNVGYGNGLSQAQAQQDGQDLTELAAKRYGVAVDPLFSASFDATGKPEGAAQINFYPTIACFQLPMAPASR